MLEERPIVKTEEELRKERLEEFMKASEPMRAFLNKYYHPHAYAIVSTYDSEVVEGSLHYNVDFDNKDGKKS